METQALRDVLLRRSIPTLGHPWCRRGGLAEGGATFSDAWFEGSFPSYSEMTLIEATTLTPSVIPTLQVRRRISSRKTERFAQSDHDF